jgi:hypothetical protein
VKNNDVALVYARAHKPTTSFTLTEAPLHIIALLFAVVALCFGLCDPSHPIPATVASTAYLPGGHGHAGAETCELHPRYSVVLQTEHGRLEYGGVTADHQRVWRSVAVGDAVLVRVEGGGVVGVVRDGQRGGGGQR